MPPEPKPLVFVVDDSSTIRELVVHQLKALGCETVTFAEGAECIKALEVEGSRPDLILMDLQMEPMRGDKCCEMIREQSEYLDIPVVMLTGENSPHEIMHSWRAGADDFLPKPIKKAQLASKIDALKSAPVTPSATGRSNAPAKVLFVEDNRFFRTVLGSALEHSGFHVLYAAAAEEAVELFEQFKSELDGIVVDLVLPSTGGIELAERFRASGFKDKPITILSGATPTPDLAKRVAEVTGNPLLEKKHVPIETVIAKLTVGLRRLTVDTRGIDRTPFFSVVEFRRRNETEWMTGFSYDVSAGGIFVRTITSAPTMSEVELKIRFTVTAPPSDCKGIVAWANPFRPRTSFSRPVGMGIRFTELNEQQAAFVQKLSRKGVSMTTPEPA